MQDLLEIGQIVKPFGIKGMVKVNPFTDDLTEFELLKTIIVITKQSKKQYQIQQVNIQNNRVLLKIQGIDTVEQAEGLRNAILLIHRNQIPELEEGTYFIVDLLGLAVETEQGEKLGNIDDIFNTGSNDIYVVKDELGKQLLLPAIKDVVKKIDLENKKIIVHLLTGLT